MKIGKSAFMILMGLCVMSLALLPASADTVKENVEHTFAVLPASAGAEYIDIGTLEEYDPYIFDELQFDEEMLKENEIARNVIENLKKTNKENITVENGIITIKGWETIDKFDEMYYEQELKVGVPFPKEMIEDEYYKPIFEQIKKDYPELVTEDEETIILKGDALKKFDEMIMEMWDGGFAIEEGMVFAIEAGMGGNKIRFDEEAGVPFPKEMTEDEYYKPIFEQIKKDYPELVTENEETIILKGDALKKFDEMIMEMWDGGFAIEEGMGVDEIQFNEGIGLPFPKGFAIGAGMDVDDIWFAIGE